MKRTPLRPKRPTPRRKAPERAPGRMKRPRVSKTAQEARHLERVAGLPCCVTGKRPVEVHHLMKAPDKRTRRDHRWVVPLHYLMHRGPEGIHGLGSEAKFEQHHGLRQDYLIAFALGAWAETERQQGNV
jgi:hypothetical protein